MQQILFFRVDPFLNGLAVHETTNIFFYWKKIYQEIPFPHKMHEWAHDGPQGDMSGMQ